MPLLEVEDLVQLISQYCPRLYCSLRLVNHEVKDMIDKVLPKGPRDQALKSGRKRKKILAPILGRDGPQLLINGWMEKFLLTRAKYCGFRLLTPEDYKLWISGMKRVFLSKSCSRRVPTFQSIDRHAEIERFCKHYHPKDQLVGRDVLELLCLCNRKEFVRELWNRNRLYSDCIREICLLDDYELFCIVFETMKDSISMDLVADCVHNAILYDKSKISIFLWETYSTDENVRSFFASFVTKHGRNIPDEPFADRDTMLTAISYYPCAIIFADESLLNDREIIFTAVKQNWMALKFADESLLNDREIVFEAVKQDWRALEFADESLLNDREIIYTAVKQNWMALKFADESLKKDRDIVFYAVRKSSNAINYADESFNNDGEILYEIQKQDFQNAMKRDDLFPSMLHREIVLEAVTQDWHTLYLVHAFLKDDKRIVIEAVKQNWHALRFADCSLLKDRDIILEAVKQDWHALKYADESLKKDRDIVFCAVKQYRYALKYADESFKKDSNFCESSLLTWKYRHDEIREDWNMNDARSRNYTLEYE